MDAIAIGPFVLSAERFAALLALGAFVLVAEIVGRRLKLEALTGWAWNAVTLGLLAARLGFVATHLGTFAAEPLSVLFIWQGGFAAWAGVAAVVVYALIVFRERRRVLRWALAPALAAVVAWGGFQGVNALTRPAAPLTLFETQLLTLEGAPLVPADLKGRPVVVNLWATWCGPCRRELPLLASVAADEPEAVFLFVSQGESAAQVERYLAEQGLELELVALDPTGVLGVAARSRGLPTTLFFDREGVVAGRSLGELSRARLQDGLNGIR